MQARWRKWKSRATSGASRRGGAAEGVRGSRDIRRTPDEARRRLDSAALRRCGRERVWRSGMRVASRGRGWTCREGRLGGGGGGRSIWATLVAPGSGDERRNVFCVTNHGWQKGRFASSLLQRWIHFHFACSDSWGRCDRRPEHRLCSRSG